MKVSVFLIFVLSMIASFVSYAQEETATESKATMEDAQPEAKEAEAASQDGGRYKNVEKLEVTGSHIKRIDVEGPSPIFTIDQEYLQRTGYNSVADVLRDSTLTTNGVGRESAGSSVSGSATAGLRGFGSDKVLVLLNGTRLPKIGGGNSVDLNLIPIAAIERVEILKDGASAIYGSDALAGVFNFITKKDFDGASVMTRYSHAAEAGGGRQDFAATWGKNFSKGNILAVYQYRNNQEIRDKDRDWTKTNNFNLSTLGSPGSYRPVGGNWAADPNCANATAAGSGTFCRFDFTPYSMMQPAIEQHSGMVAGTYQINANLSTYGNALYTQRQSRWQYAPAPDIFADDTSTGGKNFEVPNAVNSLPGWSLPGIGANNFELRYRLVDELGPRANRDTTDSYGGTVGVKGYMFETWEWDYSVTYGTSKIYNRGHAGYANKDILFQELQNGNWTPFNNGNFGSVASAKHVSEQWINSELTMTQFKTSGEVANVGSGILSSAFGVSAAWESYNQRVDDVTQAGALFGGAGSAGQGSRNFQAIFAELALAISDWEFQLAGRYDKFSDFGDTINPKFAVRYRPVQSLMFRGSVGTGFKAPTLEELYDAQGYGYPTYVDQTACAANPGDDFYCSPQQWKTLSGGNRNLKQETSFSYNLGTTYQPMRDMSFTLDYWFTEIKDAIGVSLNDLMLAELKLGTGALAAQGVTVNRTGGLIDSVVAPNLNLAKQRTDGIDFAWDYTFNIGSVKITPTVNHSHILSYQNEGFPGLGLFSKMGDYGRPQWRNTSYITVGFLEDHSVRATARTIAGQFKQEHTVNRDDHRRIPTYTEYDLNYNYNAFWGGVISAGIRNVLATKRPIDDTAGFAGILNSSLYDQVGQLYYLGYTHNF
ncbi:MAG: TonB-dependent receptor [Bdellovibrionales bacterium]|nr:TonB-dependent receptor [Bdellovibrionales bacterium]